MEDPQKLIDEICDITCLWHGDLSDYEAIDISIKMLSLQEQRKQSAYLDNIETRLMNIEVNLL